MNGSKSNLAGLLRELDYALDLIDGGNTKKQTERKKGESGPLTIGDSLLERCEAVASSATESKPKIRIIHHFACSGGTLISKCISTLPNTFLLSEAHPHTNLHMGGGKPKYLPSDLVTLSRYANIPSIGLLEKQLFKANIKEIALHVVNHGGSLVIRDHTHSDFCVGDSFSTSSTVADYLREDFKLVRLATIRNPIDSYMSLVKNNWVHFLPSSFDEYCKRFIAFTSEYKQSQIIKYEDFVSSPKKLMRKISKKLELPYSDSFSDIFDVFSVTGDSGRSGNQIEPRDRRELTDDIRREIEDSRLFRKISQDYGYSMDKGD